jgi:hypothetical protein
MKIDNFFTAYSTEDSCKLYFRQQREATGIVCRKCGGAAHYSVEMWYSNGKFKSWL